MPIDYYLALLQLHIAIVGLVIAGVVALVQLLNNAKPQRDIRLLVRRRILILYGALLGGLLIVLAYGCWVSAFPDQAQTSFGGFGQQSVGFYNDGRVALLVIAASLTALIWFGQLAFRVRTLLDSRLYLQKYVERLPVGRVQSYLEAIYTESDPSRTILFDPFQPIREYIKDNCL